MVTSHDGMGGGVSVYSGPGVFVGSLQGFFFSVPLMLSLPLPRRFSDICPFFFCLTVSKIT